MIERRALAEMTLAPHVEDSSQILTPELAIAEFHDWLMSQPKEMTMNPQDVELYELIGVR